MNVRSGKLARWLGTVPTATRIRAVDVADAAELAAWVWPSLEAAELAEDATDSADALAEGRGEVIRWRLVAEREGAPIGTSTVFVSKPPAQDGALGAMLTDRGRDPSTAARQAEAAYRLLLQGQAGVVRTLTAQLDRMAAQVAAAERRAELAEMRLRESAAEEIAMTQARSSAELKSRMLGELLPLGKLLLAGKAGIPDDAVTGWLRSLSQEQLGQILPVLSPAQLAGIQTMLDRAQTSPAPDPS